MLDGGLAKAPLGGYRAVLADGLFRRYALTMTILMIAGYAAINTGFVGFRDLRGQSRPRHDRHLVRGQHLAS